MIESAIEDVEATVNAVATKIQSTVNIGRPADVAEYASALRDVCSGLAELVIATRPMEDLP